MSSRRPRSPPDDLGEDDPTRVDASPFVSALNEVPAEKTMPRCVECGRVVFFDDFSDAASIVAMGLFSADRCVRSRDGRMRWCGEVWELRYRPPR